MVQLNRPKIGFFGPVNAGKSSLINALTGQQVSVVAPQPGTTTDPVKKIIELLGIGPVELIDTAGIDDTSPLGSQRVARTQQTLDQVDLAILVCAEKWTTLLQSLLDICRTRNIACFVVQNKTDLPFSPLSLPGVEVIPFTCHTPDLPPLLAAIQKHLPARAFAGEGILDEFITAGNEVILVMPQDASAPQGRLILPQVQTLRNLLDIGATAVCVQPAQLAAALKQHAPKLVVTDSQVFKEVNELVPAEIPLTSFSILFSRLKGDFDAFLQGTTAIDRLPDGARILMLESCTHTVNKCDDIGRVKIPRLLEKFTGKKLAFTTVSNIDPLPPDLGTYKLAIQCGGCMVTRTQIIRRLSVLKEAGVPVSNYGLTIAWCNGIFARVTEIFRKK